MPLHDAIMALSPIHYWPFATAAGDLSAPDIVGTLPFSSLVNDGGGISGPEMGTTSQRLFSDQIWTTPALNANAFVASTWLALVSQPATGAQSSYVDFLGWGDPNNRTARGWRIEMRSSTTPSASYQMAGFYNVTGVRGAVWPELGWHLVWWQYNAGATSFGLQTDGQVMSFTSAQLTVNPINSDQLWLQSSAPIAIAHMAAFNYQLSTTQIQTITSQIVHWPLQVPVNMPITAGSGTVDLTPVLDGNAQILNNQSTYMPQIGDIDTKVPTILNNQGVFMPQITDIQPRVPIIQQDTHNIVNNLFPQLEVPLNDLTQGVQNILNGITATLDGVGGAITQTIGQIFSGKTLDTLTEADLGTVCFPDTLSSVQPMGGSPFGLALTVTAHPDWYIFTGPGEYYSQQVLFILDIARGGTSVLHQGVHTLTHLIYPMPGIPNFPIYGGLPIDPGDYVITVTPNAEVCVSVKVLTFP